MTQIITPINMSNRQKQTYKRPKLSVKSNPLLAAKVLSPGAQKSLTGSISQLTVTYLSAIGDT